MKKWSAYKKWEGIIERQANKYVYMYYFLLTLMLCVINALFDQKRVCYKKTMIYYHI